MTSTWIRLARSSRRSLHLVDRIGIPTSRDRSRKTNNWNCTCLALPACLPEEEKRINQFNRSINALEGLSVISSRFRSSFSATRPIGKVFFLRPFSLLFLPSPRGNRSLPSNEQAAHKPEQLLRQQKYSGLREGKSENVKGNEGSERKKKKTSPRTLRSRRSFSALTLRARRKEANEASGKR
jgi:hypothetical protein